MPFWNSIIIELGRLFWREYSFPEIIQLADAERTNTDVTTDLTLYDTHNNDGNVNSKNHYNY